MTEVAMEFSDEFVTKSEKRLSTKNAWALYVRRRWRENLVAHVEDEWDLTNGEARGVVYAQASQNTIDKILDHKRGGFALGLLILEIRFQHSLADFIEQERGRNARLRSDLEARNRRLGEMLDDVRSFAPVDRPRPRRRGAGKTGDVDH